MNKKKIIILVSLAAIALIVILFYNAQPKDFPNDKQLIENMNGHYPEAGALKVQAATRLDERHAVVPFISSDDHYGVSYWIWKGLKWKLARVDTGEPKLWKLNANDPSTYYLVWNIDPKDQLNRINYYLIGPRGYSITQKPESNIYTPKIQKQFSSAVEEQTYGVLQLPEEWVQIMSSSLQLNKARQPSDIFQNRSFGSPIHVAWMPINQAEEMKNPIYTFNGGHYQLEKINLDYLQIINQDELELP
ncbi:hypothetical protein FHS15_004278 [Paenibacillus castaneae]|uniref:hypothetical protein n=1 Tax=Paenibacillus castaneae TaxID=474957 RepID=UPI000C9CD1E4|nr:hypothetical protein [Paenibacillus castaneae]NIK79120.1 hypothetical protein [Paenibacillus castaneae]